VPAAGPAPRLTLTRVSLHPRTFRASRGTTVRFTLSAAARVTITAGRVKKTVGARAGANAVRFKPRRGTHRLTITGPGVRASATFSVRR
jgi:hypothetical protein